MSLDTENQKPTESVADPVDTNASGSDPANTEQTNNDATDCEILHQILVSPNIRNSLTLPAAVVPKI